MPPYLRPMAPTAPAAILCGDPARALTLAQALLVEPRMSNHHRGLWGYYGRTEEGEELSVQATGIGGAGAAIVLGELAGRGLRRAVRVGSARSASGRHPVGSCVLVDRVRSGDGTSVAYGAVPGTELRGDPELGAAIAAGCDARAGMISLDRLDPPDGARGDRVLHDLQSAALLAAAGVHGVALAVTVVVARDPVAPLQDEAHEAASLRLGRLAAAALSGASGARTDDRGGARGDRSG